MPTIKCFKCGDGVERHYNPKPNIKTHCYSCDIENRRLASKKRYAKKLSTKDK